MELTWSIASWVVDYLGINEDVNDALTPKVVNSYYQDVKWYQRIVTKVLRIADYKVTNNIPLHVAMHKLASNVLPRRVLVKNGQNMYEDAIEVNKGVLVATEPAKASDAADIPLGEEYADYQAQSWVLFGALDPAAYVIKSLFTNEQISSSSMLDAEQMEPYFEAIANYMSAKILSLANLKTFAMIALRTFNNRNPFRGTKDINYHSLELTAAAKAGFELQSLREQVKEMTATATATMTDAQIIEKFKPLFPCIAIKGAGQQQFKTIRKIVDLNDKRREIEKQLKQQQGAKPDKAPDADVLEQPKPPADKTDDNEDATTGNKPEDATTGEGANRRLPQLPTTIDEFKTLACDTIRVYNQGLYKKTDGVWKLLQVYAQGKFIDLICPETPIDNTARCATDDTKVAVAETCSPQPAKTRGRGLREVQEKCTAKPFEGTVTLKELDKKLFAVSADCKGVRIVNETLQAFNTYGKGQWTNLTVHYGDTEIGLVAPQGTLDGCAHENTMVRAILPSSCHTSRGRKSSTCKLPFTVSVPLKNLNETLNKVSQISSKP